MGQIINGHRPSYVIDSIREPKEVAKEFAAIIERCAHVYVCVNRA